MAVKVSCRGCGTQVARGAGFCFICRCPDPAGHAAHLAPASLKPRHFRPWAVLRSAARRLTGRSGAFHPGGTITPGT